MSSSSAGLSRVYDGSEGEVVGSLAWVTDDGDNSSVLISSKADEDSNDSSFEVNDSVVDSRPASEVGGLATKLAPTMIRGNLHCSMVKLPSC